MNFGRYANFGEYANFAGAASLLTRHFRVLGMEFGVAQQLHNLTLCML